MAASAAAYETAEQYALPYLAPWQSHAITALVFAIGSTLAVYLALRRRSGLLAQLQRHLAERKEAEESRRCRGRLVRDAQGLPWPACDRRAR